MCKISSISDLIDKLQKIKNEHGDLPVFINDADTRGFQNQGWNLEINEVLVFEKDEIEKVPKRVLMGGDYYD